MTKSINVGRFPDAFPSPTYWESTKATTKAGGIPDDLFDAGDAHDEQLLAEWAEIEGDPTRPGDRELLPKKEEM